MEVLQSIRLDYQNFFKYSLLYGKVQWLSYYLIQKFMEGLITFYTYFCEPGVFPYEELFLSVDQGSIR